MDICFRNGKYGWLAPCNFGVFILVGSLFLAHYENAKIIDSFGVIVLTSRLQLMYSVCGYFEWEFLGPLFSCQNILIGLKSRVLDG